MDGVSGVDMTGDTVDTKGIMDRVLGLDLAEEMTGVEIMDGEGALTEQGKGCGWSRECELSSMIGRGWQCVCEWERDRERESFCGTHTHSSKYVQF